MQTRHCWRLVELLLLAAFICIGRVGAAQSISSISYERQSIGSIDLVAAPDVNLQALWPLVELRTGESYSKAKALATASALRTAGHFDRVDFDITPEANGLRLRFLLQPIYYLGIVTFPGALNKFDYPQLLQVVNYPEEAPYDKKQAESREGALLGFFTNEGYFVAQVHEHTELDRAHKLANVVYDVTLGQRAKFGSVQVAGPPPGEAKRILGALRSTRARVHGADIRAGKTYYPARISRASRTIQEYLGNHGWLASRVAVVKPQYDAKTNRVPIQFQVELGPKVQVRVEGARVSKKNLQTLIPVYQEKSFDRDLADEGARNLAAYFQSKGYFDAKVSPEIVQNPSQISLTYVVERGHRHKVMSVQFAGNRHVDEDNLDPMVTIQTAHFFSRGKFSEESLNQSAKNITNYYHDAGFEGAKVAPKVTDIEPKLYITFQITEGPRTIVNALDVEGIKTQKVSTLAPGGLELRAGRPFSPGAITRDRNRIVASYLNLGYLDVSFQARSSPLPGERIDVTYIIHEGPQARVKAVEILGERRTKPAYIRSNAGIRAGAPLSQGAMLQAESALYGLGIFDWANVVPAHPITTQQPDVLSESADPAAGPSQAEAPGQNQGNRAADVLLKVHESKRNSLTYGFGFISTPQSGRISTGILALPGLPAIGLPSSFRVIEKNLISPEGSLAYSRRNLLGRNQTATISTLFSRLDQRASFTYADPEIYGPGWSGLLNLSAERTTQNPLFTARVGQATLQFDRSLNSAKTEHLQFRYSFQRTSLTNLLIQGFVSREDQSIHSSTLSSSFIHDTRDMPLDAHRGVFETIDLGLTPRLLGSSDSFARAFGQAAYYRQVAPWMVWANSVRYGVVKAYGGSHVPLSDRLFTGGADSLRGFPINGAGPQTTAVLCTRQNDPSSCVDKVLVPVGGPQLFIFNSEGRFPVPVWHDLGGVIFYDGGNVYKSIGFSHFFGQYSNTVGVGLRYNTPVGPIRIDIGRNLSPLPGLNATQVFVTLGQAF